jgi:hypothetical protein
MFYRWITTILVFLGLPSLSVCKGSPVGRWSNLFRKRSSIDISTDNLLPPGGSFREQLIASIQAFSVAGGAAVLLPSRSWAVEATLREQIAENAAKIPGFGQPDVFYPSSWVGKWSVTQTYSVITEKEASLKFIGMLNRSLTAMAGAGLTTSFFRNYVEYNGKTVLDRSFTETDRFRSIYNRYTYAVVDSPT